MAGETIQELFEGSRDVTRGQNPKATLRYVIRGTDQYDTAIGLLGTTAPVRFDLLPRLSYRIIPVGPEIWFGEAYYGYFASQASSGVSVFKFDTGGGQQHITQSISTIQRYARAGQTAPNFMGAIGVSANSVDGVDIVVPVYNFSIVKYEGAAAINDTYKNTLYNLTGTVNGGSWKGYAAGEVLFRGAAGSMRKGGDWEMEYVFSASPNRTGIAIGDITGIAKKGWEYLWVQYLDDVDAAAKSLIKRPHSVHIEQVYPSGDFSDLHV